MKLAPGMVAVVTGAASGLGRALAELLGKSSIAVALADVEAEPLASAASDLRQTSGAAVLDRALDVADPAAVDGLAAAVAEVLGPVDLVCNVAGVVGPRLPTWEQGPADWTWVWQVNVYGVANVLRAFLPQLVARNRGHVVNVASIAGLAPIAGGGNAPYAASKYAVVGLSETLRVELDSSAPNVGVTVVCPGPVATRIRDAERNRPVALGGGRGWERPAFENPAATITAVEAAGRILAGVEENRFYVLTNPENAAQVRDRVDRLLADLPG